MLCFRNCILGTITILSVTLASPALAEFYVGKTKPAAAAPAPTAAVASSLPSGAAKAAATPVIPPFEYRAALLPGSLKENVIRIAASQDWGRVVWKPSYDYLIVQPKTLTAASLPGILDKILAPYPLKAVVEPLSQQIIIEALTHYST